MTQHDLPTEQADVGALGKELGIALPRSARVHYLQRESEGDGMVRAKLSMSQADFDQLELPVKRDALRPGPGRLGTDHEGWDPHATSELKSGQVQLPDASYVNIGVAPAKDGNVTLFVFKHGT